MNSLNQRKMHNMYLVIDNASIYHAGKPEKYVHSHGYKYVYLRPYSPFLSSIKECLTKMNEVFRYKRLTEEDPLDKRIIHATYEINMSDLQNWVKYSIQFFFLCLQEVKKL